MTPQVSVVMSVYNGQPYLSAAVETILHQTFTDFELIVIDDGSTDDTAGILATYQRQDARIQLLQNERNLGLTFSLNKGMQAAQGIFLARHDADDLSHPKRLARQVDFMTHHPAVGVVGTWVDYIDESGQKVGTWKTPQLPELVNWSLLFGTTLAHPTVMMRRNLFKDGPVYCPDIAYAQDYDLWVRLSKRTQLANLPQALYCRRHQKMIGVQHQSDQEKTVQSVMREALGRLLPEPPGAQTVTMLRRAVRGQRMETPTALKLVTDLILHLHTLYQDRNSLPAAKQALITADAARRLEKLAWSHLRCWPLVAGWTLVQAFRLNHKLPVTRSYLRQGLNARFKVGL